jgi:hypothetical protein
MNDLTKEYYIEGIFGGLNIQPLSTAYNSECYGDGNICLVRRDSECADIITLTTNEARELVVVLKEIIDAVDKTTSSIIDYEKCDEI